jgi:chromosome segregation ATPase
LIAKQGKNIMSVVNIESVTDAFETLQAEGRRPTTRAIQERLRGGSLSTIHAFLKQLKAQAMEIPAELENTLTPLIDAGKQIIKATLTNADSANREKVKDLEEEVESFSRDLLKSENEKMESLEKITELEAQLNMLTSELTLVKESREAEKRSFYEIQEELAQLRLKKEDYKLAREEISSAIERAARLEGRLEEREKEALIVKNESALLASRIRELEESNAELKKFNLSLKTANQEDQPTKLTDTKDEIVTATKELKPAIVETKKEKAKTKSAAPKVALKPAPKSYSPLKLTEANNMIKKKNNVPTKKK